MIVTTAGRATSQLVSQAKKLANKYGLTYKERNGVSVETMKTLYHDSIVVVGNEQLFISPLNDNEKLFFHPNLAMVRARRILKGEVDLLVEAARLDEGMSFLDCTLGLASDSIIASIAVGESGLVTGIEGNPLLYLLATEGLSTFSSGIEIVDQGMRRIKTVHSDHFTFLKQAESNSYDVVYFDPMFQTAIDESHGINPIRSQAIKENLTEEIIHEAKRVAKKRVVLKDHWKSERFAKYGFLQLKRKTALFHYGVLEIEN